MPEPEVMFYMTDGVKARNKKKSITAHKLESATVYFCLKLQQLIDYRNGCRLIFF